MSPPLSSISFSKPAIITTLLILAWILIWLVIFDLIIFFAVPPASVLVEPNKLQKYFEYGRSVEGKLFNMIGPTDETTTPIAQIGWLTPERWQDRPNAPETPDSLLIANYGMSFAQHVGRVLAEEPYITVRFIGGPAAPPNHTYAAFLLDEQSQAEVVLMGIQASSVVEMRTNTSMNSAFEHPLPFTYPKYHLTAQGFKAVWPPVRDLATLRQVMNDSARWQAYVQQLKREDSFYDPFLFHHNIADYSALVRFARRAWSKNVNDRVLEAIYGPDGFDKTSEVIKVLQLMVIDFAERVRSQGRLPILMLFNTRGYADHLYRALAETISAHHIPTMSTHTLAPADEPRHFLGDGHFNYKANKQFAQVILTLITQQCSTFSHLPACTKMEVINEKKRLAGHTTRRE